MAVQPAAQLSPIPEFPALSDRAAGTYNGKAYAFGAHMGGPGPFVPEINALAENVEANALEAKAAKDGTDGAVQIATEKASQADQSRSAAQAAAVAAAEQVTLAGTAAGQAEASRIEASKLNLGAKAAAPTVDNQGQALRVGATYYDTTLNKLRAWSGTAWADPVNVTAGVKSLNGEGGDLVKTTLAGYGIANFKADAVLPENVNLRSVVVSGVYRFNTAADSPAGIAFSTMLVLRSADTCAQIVISYDQNSRTFIRSGVVSSGGLLYKAGASESDAPPWKYQMSNGDSARGVPGSVIDLQLGSYFYDTVSSNKNYSFTNQMAGSSFVLEITHTGGAISFAATVWPGSAAPSLSTNRRHLFFFQLPSLANAWLASYLGNYPV